MAGQHIPEGMVMTWGLIWDFLLFLLEENVLAVTYVLWLIQTACMLGVIVR